MALIKSISGIRGTIGNLPGENLTPLDIVASAAAYGDWVRDQKSGNTILIGRDARVTGEMVSQLCALTLSAMGFEVLDAGLSTTPSVAWAVKDLNAAGGIIITASHNPAEWNALKLLNMRGEFISSVDGQQILEKIAQGNTRFASWDKQGSIHPVTDIIDRHIDHILTLDGVEFGGVAGRKFKVVVDCINSTGSISVIPLLKKLGCAVISLNDDLSGVFQHNPEPLEEHLGSLTASVLAHSADLGIAVDPDVDRLVLVDEKGAFFGEEYTIVAIADYLLSLNPGDTVSNLSSSRALRDITQAHGGNYHASAVGEVNVVEKMKAVSAVFGGEGNGGVIYPKSHYGRDALIGIALILSFMASTGTPLSIIRDRYPRYVMAKKKLSIPGTIDLDQLLDHLQKTYSTWETDRQDGLKIDLPDGWLHLRKSNTEPIVRLYAEAMDQTTLSELVSTLENHVNHFVKS
jgi:phosphomannomutase